MIKNRDIVIISLQAWDMAIGGNCRDIAKEFSRNNRVLYINSPLDRSTLWRERRTPLVEKRVEILKGRSDDLVRVEENLWTLYPKTLLESISRIPSRWMFDIGNRINNRRLAEEIKSAIRRLGFRDIILFNDNNMYRGFYLKELLNPRLYVYYSRDNLLAIDFWKLHGKRIEPLLMKKADLVVSNSTYLTNIARKYNPNSIYAGQGCDLSMYDEKKIFTVPEDIVSIPYPVIGYSGVLFSLRLDIEIIRYLARQNPRWNVVLIGPEDDDFRNSGLHSFSNVHFLGNKRPEELPAYVSHFDVAINPQKLNELTIGNYPRKIDEYLAMGKPVVATKTEAMSAFSEFCSLAENKEEFSLNIENALLDDSPVRETERQVFTREHTWEKSVEKIYLAMDETMAQKQSRYGSIIQDINYQ